MNDQIDDPKLTAFALGELDEAERSEVEKLIAHNAEAKRFVEETRAFAGQLEARLKSETVTPLTELQKSVIAETAIAQGKVTVFPRRAVWWTVGIAAAACLLLLLGSIALPVFSSVQKRGAQSHTLALAKQKSLPDQIAKDARGDAMLYAKADSPKRPTVIDEGKSEVDRLAAATATTPATPLEFEAPAERNELAANETLNDAATLKKGQPALGTSAERGAQVQSRLQVQSGPVPAAKPLAALSNAPSAGDKDGSKRELAGSNTFSGGVVVNGGQLIMSGKIAGTGGQAAGGARWAKRSLSFGYEKKSFNEAIERDAAGQPDLPVPDFNTEAYDHIADNPFLRVDQNPLSTFSIDVDTGSYANVRRFLTNGQLPPKDAVRIEELLNYFPYDYPQPTGDDPFSVNVEVAPAPWNPEHKIARIGLKGREVAAQHRPACNLVFLLDVSGSMDEPNKLPLVKESMKMLVPKLNERDRVAIVVYAGASGMVLPSTEATKRNEILRAIDVLRPGGSTNGAAGIQLAYDIAKANFIKGGANRVILATDGDFNVGTTNQGALVRLVEEKAKSGVFLTVLGFGMGNLKDSMLEKLADKGNGTYGYIDTKKEAEKTFVEQIGGTLVTIAKDVKIQIEFNPARIGAFRLIGYENRILRHEDFNDDKKDAGEIGAGHTVTALYELVPAGNDTGLPGVDPLKYQKPSAPVAERESASSELMTVKLRYKQPDGDTSKLLQKPVADTAKDATPSKDLQFAAAVAEFGMVLRESPHKGNATFDTALSLAENGLGSDAHGYRHEFMDLVRKAKSLTENR